MTTIPLFMNPRAGRGHAVKKLPAAIDALRAAGVTVNRIESEHRGDLEARITEAVNRGAGRVLVAGGDGSVHEAVNGICNADQTAELGILPVGTGNDFAKAAGIPLDPGAAGRELGERLSASRAYRRSDVGRCNERWFINGAGIGIDARVAHYASGIRLPMGDLVYVVGVARCLIEGIHSPAMRVSVNGEKAWAGQATLVNIANGSWLGGRFHIAPDARIDDQQFDVVIADAVTRRRVVSLVTLLQKGRHLSEKEIHHCRGERISVESEEPVLCHLDGELQAPCQRFDIQRSAETLTLL